MSKIFRATVPLTQRLVPVFGAVLILFGLIASSQTNSQTTSPTIATDKSDYMPGDTVVIMGSGWVPGQPVDLQIDESDNDLPWTASVLPDLAGNFSNSDFVVQAHDIGVLFTLSATQGPLSVWTQFTDVVGPGIAPNGDTGGFEIEGNVVGTAAAGHTDWIANSTGPSFGLLATPSGAPLDPTVTFRRLDGAGNTAITADDIFAGRHQT